MELTALISIKEAARWLCMCVPVRSEVTQGVWQSKTPNMCTWVVVARSLSFTHASADSLIHMLRHISAPLAQEGDLKRSKDSGVTSTAISTHLSYQHYIRIDWPLHWVVIWSYSMQGIDSLELSVFLFFSVYYYRPVSLSLCKNVSSVAKETTLQGAGYQCFMLVCILCN